MAPCASVARAAGAGIAGEGVPFLLAVGEAVPFEQVVQGVVRRADQNRPEAHLADAGTFQVQA